MQKPSKIISQHAYYHRDQADGEPINVYVTVLHRAALPCESWELDDALMDWIICGIWDIELQQGLLAKPELTLQQAIGEALALETAKHSAQELCKARSLPTSQN